MSKFHPQTFVPIQFACSPIEDDFADRSCFYGRERALLFCYFNNSTAFNEYLNCFQPLTLILVGPKDNVGIHTDPMPLSPEFKQTGWRFLECKYLEDNLNVICIYRRRE